MKHTILVIDDEVDNVDALERLFRKKYTVLKATSSAQGLAHLKENSVSIIISDQRMPKMTGVEFLKESIRLQPDAIRMLLTGYTDIESAIEAINSGEVYRYINKPWDPIDLQNTVDKAVEKFELRQELKEKNIQLEKAYDELKSLDEAKSNFMILINHELKTPLTVILSFVELLKETTLTAEQQKFLSRIDTSSQKLKRIIDDVLLFVSAETGVLKIARKKVSTKKLAQDLSDKFTPAAEERGQTIKLGGRDVEIKADPSLLGSALERLVDNAIKFGEKDSDIEIEWEIKDKDLVEVSVTNRGKALPEKTIEKILKPFTLDEDIMKHSQGLGLGLSLTQALLKQHESKLQIECPKGRVRASFTIERA